MKQLFTLLLFTLLSFHVQSQDAKVQFINNAPKAGTPGGQNLDVYINGLLLPELTSLSYLEATHFINLPSGIPLTLSIALSPSNSVADAFKNIPVSNFAPNANYTAEFVGETGSVTIPFDLIFHEGTSTSNPNGKVDVLVAHGSPFTPPLDFELRDSMDLVQGINYKQFAQITNIPARTYLLDVSLSSSNNILQTYALNLSAYAGQAFTLIASGFLENTPAFGISIVLINGNVIPLVATPTAKIQFIQNAAAPTIDIYVQNQQLINNLVYRSASAFLDVPAGASIPIGVALANSVSINDTIYTRNFNFINGGSYVLTSVGLFGNNVTPFQVVSYDNARRKGIYQDSISTLFIQGSTNASKVDVRTGSGVLVFQGVNYPEYQGYRSFYPVPQAINVLAANTNQVLGSYNANLSNLQGKSMTMVLSGESGGLPGLTLFGVLTDGSILNFIENNYAKVQLIQNTVGPTLDIYLNGNLLVDNMARQSATQFMDMPGNSMIQIAVAPANSTGIADAFYQTNVLLGIGRTYQMVLYGERDNLNAPLGLFTYDDALETGRVPNKVSVNFTNTAIGLGEVDLYKNETQKLFTGVNSPGTRDYIELDAELTVFDLTQKNTNHVLGRYQGDWANFQGEALTLITSGKYHGDPDLSLLAVHADGRVDTLLDQSFAKLQIIHNGSDHDLKVYSADTTFVASLLQHKATTYIRLKGDQTIHLGFAIDTSSVALDTFYQIPLSLEIGKNYQIILEGEPGNPGNPFRAIVNGKAVADFVDFNKVLVNIVNSEGVDEPMDAGFRKMSLMANNLPENSFSNYSEYSNARYLLDLWNASGTTILGTYEASFQFHGSEVITLFTSPDSNNVSGIGVWAANSFGSVWKLLYKPTAYVQLIQNAPSLSLDVYRNDELWLDAQGFRTATPWTEIQADTSHIFGFADGNSVSILDTIFNRSLFLQNGKSYVIMTQGAIDDPETALSLLILENAKQEAGVSNKVAVNLVHQAFDLDAIKAKARKSGIWTSNLSYGNATGYQDFDAVADYLDITEISTQEIIGTYNIPFNQFPGKSIVVFLSGIREGDPALRLLGAFEDGSIFDFEALNLARLQVFNNSKDALTDIYLGDSLWMKDFIFASGSAYIDLPSDSLLNFGFAPANSSSSADIQAVFPINLKQDSIYQWISSGHLGDAQNPLQIYFAASKIQSDEPDQADVRFFQGTSQIQKLDVKVHNGGLLISQLDYTEYSNYLALSGNQILFDLIDHDKQQVLGTFEANIGSWQGQGVTIIVSESPNDSLELALYALLPSGDVFPLLKREYAYYQLIQNSRGPGIDVYQGLNKFIDNMAYKTAKAFIEIPAGINLQIGFAPNTSVNAIDIIKIVNLLPEANQSYIIIANGIIGDPEFPFDAELLAGARTASSTDSTTEFVLFHGALDSMDIEMSAKQYGSLQSSLPYGQFGAYNSLLSKSYILHIKDAASGDLLRGYSFPAFSLAGESITLVLSGLENGTEHWILYGVLSDGSVLTFPEHQSQANIQFLQNTLLPVLDLYVNGVLVKDNFEFRTATPFLNFNVDLPLQIGLAMENSTGAQDTFLNVNYEFANDGDYLAVMHGIPGNLQTPVELSVISDVRTSTFDPDEMDIRLVAGTPDAPLIDLLQSNTTLFDNIDYTGYSDYVSQIPADYIYTLTNGDNQNEPYGSFKALFSGYAGEVLTLFSSGILVSGVGIQLWVLLTDGQTIQLDYHVGVRDIAASISNILTFPNPASDVVDLQLESDRIQDMSFQWFNAQGQAIGPVQTEKIRPGQNQIHFPLNNLPNGMYLIKGNAAGIQILEKVSVIK